MHGDVAVTTIGLDPRNVSAARHFVLETSADWGFPATVCHSAAVVVTELVTNAFLHGRSDVELRLERRGGALRLEVRDEDTRLPVPTQRDEQALGGRGLELVSAVTCSWGAERLAHGKCVWAEMRDA